MQDCWGLLCSLGRTLSTIAGLLGVTTVAWAIVSTLAQLLWRGTEAWAKGSVLARLFGGTLSHGLECLPKLFSWAVPLTVAWVIDINLTCAVGGGDVVAWVRVSPKAELLRD